mmetsp:Transcript_53713/g.115460  ORF Transcript_53713/g.115460 Transcript_53713/m.115460 type:complete len:261 (-) Transcript_53713:39-821(-)
MHPSGIGELLVARPISATLASALMTRLLAKGRVRRIALARVGTATLLTSYMMWNLVSCLPAGGIFYAMTAVQLMLQAVGHFTTTLSCNALLISMLPEDQLANATAMQKVIGSSLGLLVSTANLCLVRAVGSETAPESYRLPWLSLVCLSLAIAAATCLAPSGIGQAYSTLVETEVAETEAETAGKRIPAPAAVGEGVCEGDRQLDSAVVAASLGRPAAESEDSEAVLLDSASEVAVASGGCVVGSDAVGKMSVLERTCAT